MNIIMLMKMATVPSDTMLQGCRGSGLVALGCSWTAGLGGKEEPLPQRARLF